MTEAQRQVAQHVLDAHCDLFHYPRATVVKLEFTGQIVRVHADVPEAGRVVQPISGKAAERIRGAK